MAADPERHALSAASAKKGAYIRPATKFHNTVSCKVASDSAGVWKAEAGRYHLYVSMACPWAHRTLAVRKLKGLEDAISFSSVDPFLTGFHSEEYVGWSFTEEFPDPLHDDTRSTWDLYKKSDASYPRKYLSVPILWDKKKDCIVNNESSQIIKFLNAEFNEWAKNPELDLSPVELSDTMAAIDDVVYPNINDGVYRCGFAKSQEAYDEALDSLFDALERMEAVLSKTRFLTGDKLTLSDIRLWTTLLRFDPVYVGHFKCNLKRIVEFPNLWAFVRDIYQMPGVKETVDIPHIKFHYYHSHRGINPTGIVPKGPVLDYDEEHGRDRVVITVPLLGSLGPKRVGRIRK